MNYFERYKVRTQRALNSKEALLENAKHRFEQVMNEALTTHECKYTKVNQFPQLDNLDNIQICINDVTSNDKTAYDEKNILVRKDENIDVGSYVWWDNCWWVIVFKEHQTLEIYKKLIMKVCNQIVKYKLNGVVYDIPVNIHNMTLYSDGMNDGRYMSYGDSKCRFVMGKNSITETINIDTRFIVNHDVPYRVTNRVDYEYGGFTMSEDDGIMSLILLQVPKVPNDDIEGNIADNKFSKYVDNHFIGKDICYIGEDNEYEFNLSDTITFELESDSKKIILSSTTNNKCILHCDYDLDLIGKNVKLIIKNDEGVEITNKTILIKGV